MPNDLIWLEELLFLATPIECRFIIRFLLKNFRISKSQVFQDLFVLFYMNKKKTGYFIEVGGGNGVDISNSFILEKNFNWKGMICEPNIYLQENIKKNRSAKLITNPITDKSIKKVLSLTLIRPNSKFQHASVSITHSTAKSKGFLEMSRYFVLGQKEVEIILNIMLKE